MQILLIIHNIIQPNQSITGMPGHTRAYRVPHSYSVLQNLLQAPTAHLVTVVPEHPFIEQLISTIEIEVQILLRVGKQHNLLAAMFADIILIVVNHLSPKSDALHSWIYT